MAQRFGVSRTAVREAVKALREKGLVEAYSGRGTFITDGTSQAVRQSLDLMVKIGQPEGSTHLAEVRAILEPEIAALAAMRCQEDGSGDDARSCRGDGPGRTGSGRLHRSRSGFSSGARGSGG